MLVDDELSFEPVPGVQFFRTRRPLDGLCDRFSELPIARIEPAALLFAAYERSPRTAEGLLAAVVQQRLTSPDRLLAAIETMRPLRRAKRFRLMLGEVQGGATSLAELDIDRMCRRFGLPHARPSGAPP